jgi:hypothetical protein
VLVAALAFPFMLMRLRNATLAPMGLPAIGYWRALGMLLLWWVVRTAGKGFKVPVKLRLVAEGWEPPQLKRESPFLCSARTTASDLPLNTEREGGDGGLYGTPTIAAYG